MDFAQIISAVLAGGIAGQLTTLIIGNRYTAKRDFHNWLRSERFKVFSELIACASVSESREGYDNWPEEIRALCQKVHLLYPEGTAPPRVSNAMERIFLLALHRKLGRIKDQRAWRQKIRIQTRELRQELAKTLHSKDKPKILKLVSLKRMKHEKVDNNDTALNPTPN